MQSAHLASWPGLVRWRGTPARLQRSGACIVCLFVLTSCAAAYSPPPLTPQHPAHPEAPTISAPPPSQTLAYGPGDLPAPQPVSVMAQRDTSPSGHGAPAAGGQSQQMAVGEGKVIAVVPGSSQLVVDHKAIPGFMDAMTMGYRVEPASLLGTVKAGDAIRFTIDTQQKAIVTIEKLTQ